jgi:hypothetical protein
MMQRLLLVVPLCFLLGGRPGHADSRGYALAAPLAGITIDGQLDDWPADLPAHALSVTRWAQPLGAADDYSAAFRVGFNAAEKALYVAVAVEDDSNVPVPEGPVGYDVQDGCEVMLKLPGFEPVQYSLRADSLGVSGGGATEAARVAAHWQPGGYQFEGRFDLDRIHGQAVQPVEGTILKLDVALYDVDRDGSVSYVAWMPGDFSQKLADPATQMSSVLLADPASLGRVEGRIDWEDAAEGARLGRVRIESVPTAEFSLALPTDSAGAYALELPPGSYQVSAGYRRAASDTPLFAVQTGATTRLEPVSFARPPWGQKVAAGPGKRFRGAGQRVRADAGSRRGSWITLTPADGLPISNIHSIHQDGQGNLWFGSWAGIARYDGQEFVALTTYQFTFDPTVGFVEDSAGNLWFSTSWFGVTRYDGESFVTFSTEDGLADNYVRGIRADGAGNVWFLTPSGVTRYDGQSFTTYTEEDARGFGSVWAIEEDSAGNIWFGGLNDGTAVVSRYDGEDFVDINKAQMKADLSVRRRLRGGR